MPDGGMEIKMKKRLVIGMSGASGAPLTIELLKQLKRYQDRIETHLKKTKGAQMTLEQETDYTLEELVKILAGMIREERMDV